MPEQICPCDTGKEYRNCCGKYHDGRPAPTALALMRSRYSAFVLGLETYLLESWHPATRPQELTLDPAQHWLGLVIEATQDGQAWQQEGTVQFCANWSEGSVSGQLRERSRFVLVDGHWRYLDGELL